MFFNDPFKLVPISSLADIADKFTRNEIMSSNEIRQIVGLKPSDDPKADELRNKNLNESQDDSTNPAPGDTQPAGDSNVVVKQPVNVEEAAQNIADKINSTE